jgi:1,4-alpha-glucan branching enzyme
VKNVTLKIEEIQAISNGEHEDPFSVLGLHEVNAGGKEKLVFRCFRPDAKSVEILPGTGKPVEAGRISDEGLFEHVFSRRKKRVTCRLRITPHEGEPFVTDDPYQIDPLLSDFDLQLWGEGNHHHAFNMMGAHFREVNGVSGIHFVVSAPDASRVSVIGSFNHWDGRVHCMRKYHEQGLWEIFVPGLVGEELYKFEIKTRSGDLLKKADPYARFAELRPGTASKTWGGDYRWEDEEWVKTRKKCSTTTGQFRCTKYIPDRGNGMWANLRDS